MSRFSGKCDLYDDLVMIRKADQDNFDWSKVKILQRNEGCDQQLKMASVRDMIPYAAFLIGMSYGNQDGTYVAHIGQESFVDREERDMLTWRLEYCKSRYRSCKRRKVEFVPEDIAKELSFTDYATPVSLEIARRVKEHPTSANVDGLHLPMADRYRKDLVEEMVNYGYTEDQAKTWVEKKEKTW